jgi:hypothetical protein
MRERGQAVKSKALLSFDKPKKVRSTEDHNKTFASEAPAAGTYVPNMSSKDMRKWKAKKINGEDRRIEIRKSIDGFDPHIEKERIKRGWGGGKQKTNCSAQILMIVRPDCSVVMSANGRMAFGCKEWKELQEAYQEAIREFIKDDIRKFNPDSRWEDDQ